MRVLHLLSDWKWTGPAEPVVLLCRALRAKGVEVEFVCARPRVDNGSTIAAHAADLEPKTFLRLRKRPNLLANLHDALRLARRLDRGRFDVIHTHTTHDQILGGWAARFSRRRPPVVRTNHTGRPLREGFWPQSLMALADGLIEISEAARRKDARVFGFPPERTLRVEGCIPLERFRPDAAADDARREFGWGAEHVVAGVVARVQRHRRFDVLLEAWRRAMARDERLRGLVVGRGTHIHEVAVEPARRLGIADRVAFAGYRRGREYVAALAAMDFLVFLVPGSDGSCRAVREAMAMGKPVVASPRGLLPELVEDGRCGLVVRDTPERLAEAMLRLSRDAALRRRLGANAAHKAAEKFAIGTRADETIAFYARLPRRTKPYLGRRTA